MEKKFVTTYRLNLMDLNEEDLNLPPASFDSIITMPSVDFQKYCRDMHQFAEIVEIKSIGSCYIYRVKEILHHKSQL